MTRGGGSCVITHVRAILYQKQVLLFLKSPGSLVSRETAVFSTAPRKNTQKAASATTTSH